LSYHIEKNEMGGTCSTYGEKEKCMQGFGGEPEGKTPLGRPRHSWEDNNMMDLQEGVWVGMDWIDLAQGRDRQRALLNTVVNLWVP
jgi:hypothetical protein